MPVIPVNRAADLKIINGKNGGPRRRRGTRGRDVCIYIESKLSAKLKMISVEIRARR
jgi:hypothetical protein